MKEDNKNSSAALLPLLLTMFTSFLLIILIIYLQASEDTRLERKRAKAVGLSIERGALLYREHCRSCHGNRGEGVGQLGPPLGDAHFFTKRREEVGVQFTLREYIVSTTEYGRMMGTKPIYAGNGSTAVMPPWSNRFGGPLRSDEIADLATFVLNWKATAIGEVVLPVLELPKMDSSDSRALQLGKKVFVDQCAGCHAFQGTPSQTEKGPNLTTIAETGSKRRENMDAFEYIKESVLVPDRYRLPEYRDIAPDASCGATLTVRELEALTAFLLQ